MGVAQLADVAGPAMRLQCRCEISVPRQDSALILRAKVSRKKAAKSAMSSPRSRSRRQLKMKDIQSDRQILAQWPFPDGSRRLPVVAATTGTDTGIFLLPPIRRNLAFFEHTQKLRLNFQRHFG